ncbi:hypothetical protein NUW54_g5033 [Trametes sanguinea]|uniref:Uncharacterized protein n=1 Tax=Trametes sanguinea TaxID=158606 RepID=A0ACC1PWR8_9APHY|nr:hypothetical protein NUW54_g5033 [Trametes sanguinea]
MLPPNAASPFGHSAYRSPSIYALSMDKLSLVREALLHGQDLPKDMPREAREFVTHTLRDIDTMDLSDEESGYEENPYSRSHLLSAFEIAPSGPPQDPANESTVNKIIRLATVSAYVACNLSRGPTGGDGLDLAGGLRRIQECVRELEQTVGTTRARETGTRAGMHTRRSSSPSQEPMKMPPPKSRASAHRRTGGAQDDSMQPSAASSSKPGTLSMASPSGMSARSTSAPYRRPSTTISAGNTLKSERPVSSARKPSRKRRSVPSVPSGRLPVFRTAGFIG